METVSHEYDRQWIVGILGFVLADTLLTAIGVELGLGGEANPLLLGLVERQAYLQIALLKALALAIAYGVWKYTHEPEYLEPGVPLLIAAVGVGIVAWNTANIAVALALT